MTRRIQKINTPEGYEDIFELKIFNDRLDTLLNDKNMTQAELADVLGVTPNTVTRWKTGYGKKAVSYKWIHNIARVLNVDPEYLYLEEYSDPSTGATIEKEISEYLESFYQKNKEIIQYLKSLGFLLAEDYTNQAFCIYDQETKTDVFLDETLIERIRLIVKYTILSA